MPYRPRKESKNEPLSLPKRRRVMSSLLHTFCPLDEPSVRLRSVRNWPAALALMWILVVPSAKANGAGPRTVSAGLDRTRPDAGPGGLGRRLSASAYGQDGCDRHAGRNRGKVEGWVSNSRVASHAVPRWSSLVRLTFRGLGSCIRSDRRGRRVAPVPRAVDGFRPGPKVTKAGSSLALATRSNDKNSNPIGIRRGHSGRPAAQPGPGRYMPGSGSGSSISTSCTAIMIHSWPSAPSS